MEQQVKSKQRVADHGEVFTAEREVKAMCDLVKQETERIDSRFLEPACGDGNFLAEILSRKLAVVTKKYRRSAYDWERNALLALSSLYGVDILSDNCAICRERLLAIWEKEYRAVCKGECSDEVLRAAAFIYIVFPEWTIPFNDARFQRRDFRFDVLLKENKDESMYAQFSLFSNDAMASDNWMIDPETKELTPKPIREYPLIHYRRLGENE